MGAFQLSYPSAFPQHINERWVDQEGLFGGARTVRVMSQTTPCDNDMPILCRNCNRGTAFSLTAIPHERHPPLLSETPQKTSLISHSADSDSSIDFSSSWLKVSTSTTNRTKSKSNHLTSDNSAGLEHSQAQKRKYLRYQDQSPTFLNYCSKECYWSAQLQHENTTSSSVPEVSRARDFTQAANSINKQKRSVQPTKHPSEETIGNENAMFAYHGLLSKTFKRTMLYVV